VRLLTGNGGGWSVAPGGVSGPTLEEREAVGIEQGATVGGESQTVVADPAVDGAECREQPTPGVDAMLQHLFAMLVRGLAKVCPEGRDGVVLVVEQVAEQEQTTLLCREEENEPHHHCDGCLVEAGLPDAAKKRAPMVTVGSVERGHEDLDGIPNLPAELICDLLLVSRAFGQECFERLGLCDAEEPACTEQAPERAQGDGLFQPERGVPRGETSGLAGMHRYEHPLLAVGHQPQPHAGSTQQLDHARLGRDLPAGAGNRAAEVLPGWIGLDEEPRVARLGVVRRVQEDDIGRQRLVVFGQAHAKRRWDALALGQQLRGQLQGFGEYEAGPSRVQCLVGIRSLLAGFPLVAGQTQCADVVRVVASSPWGKTRMSTGMDRKGPEVSTSDNHSA
jgi:hypothetical protein